MLVRLFGLDSRQALKIELSEGLLGTLMTARLCCKSVDQFDRLTLPSISEMSLFH